MLGYYASVSRKKQTGRNLSIISNFCKKHSEIRPVLAALANAFLNQKMYTVAEMSADLTVRFLTLNFIPGSILNSQYQEEMVCNLLFYREMLKYTWENEI